MKNSEMAATLREFADKIDATEVEMDLRVEMKAHGVTDVNVLRAIQRLDVHGDWEVESSGSSRWIQRKAEHCEISAFYEKSLDALIHPKVVIDNPGLAETELNA